MKKLDEMSPDMGFGKGSEMTLGARQAPKVFVKKFDPLKVGIPANSRMAEDCQPVFDLLGLKENPDGSFSSRVVPEARFLAMRVRSIADLINLKVIQYGLLGDDTAMEANLDRMQPDFGEDSEVLRMLYVDGETERLIRPKQKVLTLGELPATKFSLLTRKETPNEDVAAFLRGEKTGRMATSYTRLTLKTLFPNGQTGRQRLDKTDGQNERLLRSMPDRFIAATDLVRSGGTAERYGLKAIPLMESRPGFWRTTDVGCPEREQQLLDFGERIKEILGDLMTE